MKTNKIEILNTNSYKVGMDEIKGMRKALVETIKPIQEAIEDAMGGAIELFDAEYKSRDGFIAHKHNCGGIRIELVIPKCMESSFNFLDFGSHDDDCTALSGDECICGEDDGYLDARLAVWLKFEGYDALTGELSFYLIMHGGNQDAPYFRQSNDYFEASFTCKSVQGIKKAASKHIKACVALINK